MITIAIYFYYILLLSLLATLITRLHFTFIDSIYKISAKTRKILFIFFFIVIILIIFCIIFDIISWFDQYFFHQNFEVYSTLSMIFAASLYLDIHQQEHMQCLYLLVISSN